MTLIDLLQLFDIDISKQIKILRHSSKDESTLKLLTENREILEQYQCIQNPNALNCDYVVSCIKDHKNRTIVQAIYQVKGHRLASVSDIPSHPLIQKLLLKEDKEINLEYTQLERITSFQEFEQRIVIDWGKAAISWLQSLNKNTKAIIEIRAKGKIEEFLNYDQVLLSYHQLKEMVSNPVSNQEWHQMLSVNGIYLISNNKTGQQYVGSAYAKKGDKGILSRWSEYARTGHGGNKRLMSLLAASPSLINDMQYSILTTVASNKTDKEIINLENFYKKKLGKSAVTLNHEGFSSEAVKLERRNLLIGYLQQFLNEQNLVSDKAVSLPLAKYNKVILTNKDFLFYAFISDDGFNESLLLKHLKIGYDNVYLDFDINGNRNFMVNPWEHYYVFESHLDNQYSELDKEFNIKEIKIIDNSDPDYEQLAAENKIGYGQSFEEAELKEVISQLSGHDGHYDELRFQ